MPPNAENDAPRGGGLLRSRMTKSAGNATVAMEDIAPSCRLHACVGCGLELDGDDPNDRCEECVIPPDMDAPC